MDDVQDSESSTGTVMFTPLENEENVLLKDIMNAIYAPVDCHIDHLINVIEIMGNQYKLRTLLNNYVDNITCNTHWSYERIRRELQKFADACEPPISHMQARTLAFIEKRKRAGKGDTIAYASLLRHQRRRWRLDDEVEDYLWSWISYRWAVKESPMVKHDNLVQELNALSEKLNTPKEAIHTWVRAVIISIVKMVRGGVKIKGVSARVVVRAAIDDTAP